MPQRRARLVHRLLERIGRDGAGDQIHGVVLEDAGRLARRVSNDRAAFRRPRVGPDAGEPHGERVRQPHVSVEPLNEDRVVGGDGVDELVDRERLARPGFVIPEAAEDPAALRLTCRIVAETAREVLLARRGTQVDADQFVGAADQVHVRVVEAGHEQPAASVDHPRLRVSRRPDVFVAADRPMRSPHTATACADGIDGSTVWMRALTTRGRPHIRAQLRRPSIRLCAS